MTKESLDFCLKVLNKTRPTECEKDKTGKE
jgi:hypothetical protein